MITTGAAPFLVNTFTPQQTWEMVIGQLRLQVDQKTFNAYIRDCRLVELGAESVTIAAADASARDWLASRLTRTIERQIAPLVGHEVRVDFVYQKDFQGPAGQG